jgi:rhamnulokinase
LIAPACHDTASAVAAIPASGDDWAFISSGTWSLIGTVTDRPHTGHDAMSKNYTNQGGIGSKFYFLKNVNGMWLLRQCMDRWQQQGMEWGIAELTEATSSLPAPKHLLDVDDTDFLLPGDMPARINAQLLRNGSPTLKEEPSQAPVFANLIFHSLAARYALVLKDLSTITGKKFSQLYVVGGGARNPVMHRLVEHATGLRVIRGSAESSTLGNFAIQLAAMANGPGSIGVRPEDVAQWASVLAEHDEALESTNT